MTREEAAEIIDPKTMDEALAEYDCKTRMLAKRKATILAVSALRAHQTKLDRSRWKGCEHCDIEWEPKEFWNDDYEYSSHEFRIDDDSILYHDSKFGWEGVKIKFCPFCGCPLTEEAWEVLERKIGGL